MDNFPEVGPEVPTDDIEEGRFAGSVCSYDGNEVALVNLKVNPLEDGRFVTRPLVNDGFNIL